MKTTESYRDLIVIYIRIGNIYISSNSVLDEARKWYNKCLDVAERLYASDETEITRRDLLVVYERMCDIEMRNENYFKMKEWCYKCLEITKKSFGVEELPEMKKLLERTYTRLYLIATHEHDSTEASKWLEISMRNETHPKRDSLMLKTEDALLIISERDGDTNYHKGLYGRAKYSYESCISTIKQKISDNDSIIYLYKLADIYNKIGNACWLDKNPSDAEKWYKLCYGIRDAAYRIMGSSAYVQNLAMICNKLCDLCTTNEKLFDAQMWYEKALEIRK